MQMQDSPELRAWLQRLREDDEATETPKDQS